ncbi:MAG: flavin reductase [Actinobacteria bacterium]|nr:flavin reductase [Actinomycetota bacterium]NIS31598.1 flavin reductase [Actinomycetota bacterium]NIT95776.1 flavin reductase [Actinomycetota bacterium]NIU19458.1 flavin reductase [Actinomycetota bacterium]NIU66713.1 flavin reductase [Actinomycetota bacterium]
MTGFIHDEHPFSDPEGGRDPVRRLRGRLAAPVTIVTAGDAERPVGLTVSSLVVAGDEASGMVHFVLGPDSYVWDVIQETGGFVVHVLEGPQRTLADRFAGIRPSPGGPFAGVDVVASEFGPVITACPTRAGCRLVGVRTENDHLLVSGSIEIVAVHELTDPLQWFRGGYLTGR